MDFENGVDVIASTVPDLTDWMHVQSAPLANVIRNFEFSSLHATLERGCIWNMRPMHAGLDSGGGGGSIVVYCGPHARGPEPRRCSWVLGPLGWVHECGAQSGRSMDHPPKSKHTWTRVYHITECPFLALCCQRTTANQLDRRIDHPPSPVRRSGRVGSRSGEQSPQWCTLPRSPTWNILESTLKSKQWNITVAVNDARRNFVYVTEFGHR